MRIRAAESRRRERLPAAPPEPVGEAVDPLDADGEMKPVRLSGGSGEPLRARLLWRARPFLDHEYHGLRPCVSAGVRRRQIPDPSLFLGAGGYD